MIFFKVYWTVTYIHPNGYPFDEDVFINYVYAESVEKAIHLTKEQGGYAESEKEYEAHSFGGEVCTGRY